MLHGAERPFHDGVYLIAHNTTVELNYLYKLLNLIRTSSNTLAAYHFYILTTSRIDIYYPFWLGVGKRSGQ